MRRTIFAWVAACGLLLSTECSGAGDTAGPDALTFNKDVAPIVFESCAACHHPGGSAPFSLLTYREVKPHAKQIADVTRSRFMPPWLPEPGYGAFAGERRLSDAQVGIIQQWVEEGAIEGDPRNLPAAPTWTDGWQLGKPDVVVEMPRPYTLPAEGADVFRNFVMASPVQTERYVKAVEVRPGNPKVVHHAILQIDRTPSSRRLGEQDATPGFEGMGMGQSQPPDGHFLGWTPGKVPSDAPAGTAWRVDQTTDLVLQLHMMPSGQPEVIQPSIGLYFAERPPTRHPFVLLLESRALDIPPGDSNYVTEDRFVLPVDVTVLGVYPHAHFLGKQLEAFAILPDGTTTWLFQIKDWDFYWQDEYRYAKPVVVPKDATLVLRYSYDNSMANPRNPNQPPRRVVFGNASTDEMATLSFQVLPQSRADANVLRESLARHNLGKYPGDWITHYNLAFVLQSQGRLEEAIDHYGGALQVEPSVPTVHYNLGVALRSRDRLDEAIDHYRQALRFDPDHVKARNNLANVLALQGDLEGALREYRRALETAPGFGEAHQNLANVLAAHGDLDSAITHYRLALQTLPSADTHYRLGVALGMRGEVASGITHFRQAIQIAPEWADPRYRLGAALAVTGAIDEVLPHLREAVRLKPDWVAPMNALAWILATHPDAHIRQPAEAVSLAQRAAGLTQDQDAEILDTLAAAYAATGHFERALASARAAVALASAGGLDELAKEIRARLERYETSTPYRQAPPANPRSRRD